MTADTELLRQLQRWADDLGDRVPPSRDGGRCEPNVRRGQRAILAVAIAGLLVLCAAVLWRANGASDSGLSGGGGPITVLHERYEMRIWADVRCPSAAGAQTEDSVVIDTWADKTNKRYRSTYHYPDGSTVDVIEVGSPYFPTESFARGAIESRQLGCSEEEGTFRVSLASRAVFSLNPLDEIPRRGNGDPLVIRGPEYATFVDGAFTVSFGRPALLKEEVVTGFGGPSVGDQRPLKQTSRFYLDLASGEVIESTFTHEADGEGHVGSVVRATRSNVTAASPRRGSLRPPGVSPLHFWPYLGVTQ